MEAEAWPPLLECVRLFVGVAASVLTTIPHSPHARCMHALQHAEARAHGHELEELATCMRRLAFKHACSTSTAPVGLLQAHRPIHLPLLPPHQRKRYLFDLVNFFWSTAEGGVGACRFKMCHS